MPTKFQVVTWPAGSLSLGARENWVPFLKVTMTDGLVVHLYGPVFWQISPVLPLAVTVVFCVVA